MFVPGRWRCLYKPVGHKREVVTQHDPVTLQTPLGPFRARPETEADEPFLFALFRSHTLVELAATPVDDTMRDALVRMQFRAQTSGYRAQFPNARFDILERADTPIGRLILDEGDAAGCIVDFALTAECRGRGIGVAILQSTLDRFARLRRPMRCTVLAHNEPSLRMCRRVGFRQIGEQPPFVELEWRGT